MAVGFTLLAACVPASLARALNDGKRTGTPCTDYAASTHFICRALATLAKKASEPPPLS